MFSDFFKGFANKQILFLFLALATVAVSQYSAQQIQIKHKKNYLPPPQVQNFTFGFQAVTADLFWISALQDFDYCESESKTKVCRGQGWLFQLLKLVTDLSPKFRMPYAAGGLALSVLVGDREGASYIFDRGVKYFPTDWPILSRAAYHALDEERNKMKAAELLIMAAKSGGPPWYHLLAARLYKEQGHVDLIAELVSQLEQNPQADQLLLKTLRQRMSTR